jgi:hypothetical protein
MAPVAFAGTVAKPTRSRVSRSIGCRSPGVAFLKKSGRRHHEVPLAFFHLSRCAKPSDAEVGWTISEIVFCVQTVL